MTCPSFSTPVQQCELTQFPAPVCVCSPSTPFGLALFRLPQMLWAEQWHGGRVGYLCGSAQAVCGLAYPNCWTKATCPTELLPA